MTMLRVLHVDDEPDIRELVEISLGLDPGLAVRSCASSKDALAIISVWPPHLILMDVTMPGIDGPGMLAGLRARPETAAVPVVFMTARAQARELERFKALGAIGVIAKPFDPMTLAEAVRGHLHAARSTGLFPAGSKRMQPDTQALAADRSPLAEDHESTAVLENVKSRTRALAGGGGVFGYCKVDRGTGQLDEAVISTLAGTGEAGLIDAGPFIRSGHAGECL